MTLFLASSQTCAIREQDGNYIFHNPANPDAGQATGSWQEVVTLAVRILVEEARKNGGIPGMVFAAAEAYANGIATGKISEQNEDFSSNLLAMIQQLKAM